MQRNDIVTIKVQMGENNLLLVSLILGQLVYFFCLFPYVHVHKMHYTNEVAQLFTNVFEFSRNT